MSVDKRLHDRKFVRTFFTTPTAEQGVEDSAKKLRGAIGLRGMEAPDVWVPDNEDATAPSMREEGAENIAEVVAEGGADFPGEIHPRVVWHRDSPETRYQGFQHMLQIADPEKGAVEHLDGFVIPEVGGIDDWKKADEFITIVENEYGLEEGSLNMSVIIESGSAELAMEELRDERDRMAGRVEALRSLHEEAEQLQETYAELRAELRQQNVESLERLLNETFDLVYQNDSYAGIELSPAYELTVYQKDGE
ncbi:MAG: hypothetical protein ACOCPZ_01395, partial [Natrialbaceae archaeon]